jgi:hypothetical protein
VKTWADAVGVVPASASIDRDVGEGPPRCCAKRHVSADALVYFGDLPSARLDRLRARFPALATVPDGELYLCDGCRGTVRREIVLAREEEPTTKARAT